MSRLAPALVFVVLVSAVAGGIWYALGIQPPPARIPTELVVLIDVSMSLSQDDIKTEAALAFRYIRSAAMPPNSSYKVFVVDRDVERNGLANGKRGDPHYPEDSEREQRQLVDAETKLNGAIADYIGRYPVRNRTCLMKGLGAVPNLFTSGNRWNRKVLVVSDMIEDCSDAGDPKTRQGVRTRILEARKAYPLGDLTGIEVMALVPKGQSPVEIGWLREPWDEVLKDANRAAFRIGSVDQIIVPPL